MVPEAPLERTETSEPDDAYSRFKRRRPSTFRESGSARAIGVGGS